MASSWTPDRLLRFLLAWTGFIGLFVWLPLVRGLMDGLSYEWGLIPGLVYGRGLEGAYWVLLLLAACLLSILWLGWRGARQPFHWLLLLWHVPMGAAGLYMSLTIPDLTFRGDTLGVEFPLGWLFALILGAPALMSVWWVVRDRRTRRVRVTPTWGTTSKALLGLVTLCLPVQFWLLRGGEPGSASDQAGVILTMAQWVLLNLGLVPWQSRAGARARRSQAI